MAKFLVYFCNDQGEIWLPPDESTPTPHGFIRHEANDLSTVDTVYSRLQTQQRIKMEQAAERDFLAWESRRKKLREDLLARMHSAGIGEYEREFIRHWLQLSDERKKEHYRKFYEHRELVLEMREMDKPRTAEEVMGETLHH